LFRIFIIRFGLRGVRVRTARRLRRECRSSFDLHGTAACEPYASSANRYHRRPNHRDYHLPLVFEELAVFVIECGFIAWSSSRIIIICGRSEVLGKKDLGERSFRMTKRKREKYCFAPGDDSAVYYILPPKQRAPLRQKRHQRNRVFPVMLSVCGSLGVK